jgi:hypothetical protein
LARHCHFGPAVPDDPLIATVADAAEWSRTERSSRRDDVVDTRSLLKWAFVSDPTTWNEVAHALKTAHPDDFPYVVFETVSEEPLPFSNPRLTTATFTEEAVSSILLAAELCREYGLPPDPSTLAFASTLALGSFTQRWAVQAIPLNEAANALARELWNAPLKRLSSLRT